MKIELEFELLKDVPKIEDLIAGRVYSMDCVDKSKDVKARVVRDDFDGWKCVGHSCDEGGCGRIHDEPILGVTTPVYVRDTDQVPIDWPVLPDLIRLTVREMLKP